MCVIYSSFSVFWGPLFQENWALVPRHSSDVEKATAPSQFAFTTRCGGECVAHAIQGMTDLDPRATVLSVDGIGALGLTSRAAMLEGLHFAEQPFFRASILVLRLLNWEAGRTP